MPFDILHDLVVFFPVRHDDKMGFVEIGWQFFRKYRVPCLGFLQASEIFLMALFVEPRIIGRREPTDERTVDDKTVGRTFRIEQDRLLR